MSEIKLRAGEAQDHAQDVMKTKDEVFDLLSGLRSRIDGLTDSFTGRTHDAFMGRLDEWKSSSDDLLEALFGLGKFLDNAAVTIDQVDQDLSSSLG